MIHRRLLGLSTSLALFASVFVVACGSSTEISGSSGRRANEGGQTGNATGQQLGNTAEAGSTGYIPYRPAGSDSLRPPQPIPPVEPAVNPVIPDTNVDPGIVPPGGTNPGVLPGTVPGGGTLPPGNSDLSSSGVWDQGNTMWCWAFSAYHALRAYYANTTATDAATVAWKNAVAQLNSQSAFEAFVAREYDRSTGGDPIMLVEMMQQQFNLPPQGWTDTYQGTASASQLMSDVKNNMDRGIPSVFCDGGHCVAILGVAGMDEFKIGDSSGGDIYPRSRSSLENDLDVVMVLR